MTLESDDPTLLSPEEREAAEDRLTTAYAEDRLSMTELEARLTLLPELRTRGELSRLLRDLPALASPPGHTAPSLRPGDGLTPVVKAVFSNLERGGPMRVPPHLELRSVLGNIELDLSEAVFEEGVTVIDVRCYLGNVEIELPDDVVVECLGSALLGSFAGRRRGAGRALPPRGVRGERIVRVTGRAVLGNVEVDRDG